MDPTHTGAWLQPAQSIQDTDHLLTGEPQTSFLSDAAVAGIIEQYKHDTELLKHILVAKAEEDRRRAAEDFRRAEEARLQSKYLEIFELGQHDRRLSDPTTLIDSFGSLGMSATDWMTDNLSMAATMTNSPMPFADTPPSPSMSGYLAPPSPFASFDVPFAELSISGTPSPKPQPAKNAPPQVTPTPTTTTTATSVSTTTTTTTATTTAAATATTAPTVAATTNDTSTSTNSNTSPAPPLVTLTRTPSTRERPCKRTLSRTRSQRKTGQSTKHSKRNRQVAHQPIEQVEQDELQELPQSQHQQQQQQQQQTSSDSSAKSKPAEANGTNSDPKHTQPSEKQDNGKQTLDHSMVMEALRRKLLRHPSPQRTLETQQDLLKEAQLASMSPTGVLLLDLKNPRKSFPPRKPHVASRRARPFASAHNYCDKAKETSAKEATLTDTS